MTMKMEAAWDAGLWSLLIVLLVVGSVVAEPIEMLLEAPGPEGTLRGTMLAPAEGPGSDVVLIIPGSGATDRDGNGPQGLRASTYRLLAEGLAANGFASALRRRMIEDMTARQLSADSQRSHMLNIVISQRVVPQQ